MTIIYWRNYVHMVGPQKVRGTEYFADKEATKFIARMPDYAKRKDGKVKINSCSFYAVKL